MITHMNIDLPYFQLFPYVKLVDGRRRSALYDFHGGRLFQIPRAASYVIRACEDHPVADVITDIPEQADQTTAREYLDRLSALGFGFSHHEPGRRLPCPTTRPAHKRTQLLRLSVDLRGSAPGINWSEILACARNEYHCPQLTVFLVGQPENEAWEAALVEGATDLGFHEIEWVFPSKNMLPAWESRAACLGVRVALPESRDAHQGSYTRLQEAGVRTRWCDLEASAPLTLITRASLECNLDTFSLYHQGSVHSNELHLDSAGDAFLWAGEHHHRLGNVSDGASFRALLESSQLIEAWTTGKDANPHCRGCEYRYACPNSYSYRVDPFDLTSPPSNCTYQPDQGIWAQNQGGGLFSRGGAAATRLLTKYFEMHATKECPCPVGAATLLDAVVEEAVTRLGLRPPTTPIRYYYYPDLISLQNELTRTHGVNLVGLRMQGTDGCNEIHTAYPVHTHEILHALWDSENPQPRYFVAEACATLLDVAWGTPEALAEENVPQVPNRILIVDLEGNPLDHRKHLIRDNHGLLVGQYRKSQSLHPIARHLVYKNHTAFHLGVWMDATDARCLPANFYEIGGSFFGWLGETLGFNTVLQFYRSPQGPAHLEQIFQMSLGQMQQGWLEFIETQA